MRHVVLGLSDSIGAITASHWVAALASATNAHVTAVYANHLDDATGDALEPLPADAVIPLERAEIDYEIVRREGDPATEICRVADATRAEMVIIGRRHDVPLSHPLGRLTHRLLRQTVVPVVVVPAAGEQRRRDLEPMAFVAIDDLGVARTLLMWAVEVANPLDLRLEVVLVGDAISRSGSDRAHHLPVAHSMPPVRVLLSELDPRPRAGTGVTTSADCPNDLMRRCDAGQLLIMGTHRQSPVDEALFGSVSHYCAAHSPCPVVLVPETEVLERPLKSNAV